jgi:hypothetical protein
LVTAEPYAEAAVMTICPGAVSVVGLVCDIDDVVTAFAKRMDEPTVILRGEATTVVPDRETIPPESD